MLDHNYRVAFVYKFVQDAHQYAYIFKMESGSRFVQDIEGLAGISFGEFRCQFHTLTLAAGKSGGRLS